LFLPRAKRVFTDASVNIAAQFSVKFLDLTVITAAAWLVDLDSVGLVLLADGISAILFTFTDFGLWTVLVRRTARGAIGPRTLLRALWIRGISTVICLVLIGLSIHSAAPRFAVPMLGLITAVAIHRIHEIGRAMLVGNELFKLNAAIAVGSRTLGTCVAVAGMYVGYGLSAWIVGRLLSETIQSIAVFGKAFQIAKSCPRRSESPLISEGLVFWGRMAIEACSTHLDVLLIAAWHGMESTAFFGLAARVMSAGLILVGGVSGVAFPFLARQRDRLLSLRQAAVIIFLAVGTAAFLVIFGPWALGLLLKGWSPAATETVRILGIAVLFLALYHPGVVWLEANDRERDVLKLAAIILPCSVAALLILVPSFGTVGAAWAFVIRAVLQFAGVGVLLLLARR